MFLFLILMPRPRGPLGAGSKGVVVVVVVKGRYLLGVVGIPNEGIELRRLLSLLLRKQ